MKKVFRKIHLWLSVPFGLLITLICFSGAMLVFETEVMELCHRDLYYVEKVGPAPLPMGKVAEKVAATLPDSVSVTGVTASSAPERAWQVNLSKPRRASVYVDQYTGEIKGKYERAPFFTTMFRLHRWLLDSMKPDGGIFWGKMIVGTATLMFVFVLISGIVIWWPRTKKALKNSLKIVSGKGWRRFCYDLHVAGGMYTLVLLLVMALTGLSWSFSCTAPASTKFSEWKPRKGVEDMVLRHKLLPREENGLKAGLVADREVSIVKEILSLLLQAGRRFTKN